jgi:hypothetical protein
MTLDAHTVPAASRGDQEGQVQIDTHNCHADLIATIREHYRLRCDMHRAEKALTLRIKAVCRRFCDGDKDEAAKLYAALTGGKPHPHAITCAAWVAPMVAAREPVTAARKSAEKTIEATARKMPIWSWAQQVRGFGALSLAQVVGDAGDVGSYGNPGKLWKRMGLAVFDGRAQRRVADAEEAMRHGYSPQRRSLMFVIGDNLIRAKNAEYRALYDARKAHELARDPEMKPLHAHRRAKRYMEKRLLRELWRAWTGLGRDFSPEP